MATFGWQSVNWGPSWKFFGFNTDNNVSTAQVGFPDTGTITAIVFNCGQQSGSGGIGMSARGCLWSPAGALLVAGGAVTLPVVGTGPGPYAWSTSNVSPGFAITPGTQICMGWWRDPQSAAGNNIWGFGNGGTELRGTTAGSTGAGSFGQDASDSDQIGVYVVYTPTGNGNGGSPPPPVTPTTQVQRRQVVYELMREGLLPR